MQFLANRYVLYALGAVSLLIGVWVYGAFQHHAGYALAEKVRSIADLESFKRESVRLTGLSADLQTKIDALRDSQPQIIKEYHRVEVQKPLPADCRIDSGRLQHINTSIQAANSGKPGSTMSKGQ